MQKKKKLLCDPFFDIFKLCKIAPKCAKIVQTVQKYLQIMQNYAKIIHDALNPRGQVEPKQQTKRCQ